MLLSMACLCCLISCNGGSTFDSNSNTSSNNNTNTGNTGGDSGNGSGSGSGSGSGDGSGGGSVATPDDSEIVVFHTVEDGSSLQITVATDAGANEVKRTVSYGNSVQFLRADFSHHDITVEPMVAGAVDPSGIQKKIVLTTEQGKRHFVVLRNRLSNIEEVKANVNISDTRIQIIHASRAQSNLDIYLTEPGSNSLTSPVNSGDFSYGDNDFFSRNNNNYRLQLLRENDTDRNDRLFDSGSITAEKNTLVIFDPAVNSGPALSVASISDNGAATILISPDGVAKLRYVSGIKTSNFDNFRTTRFTSNNTPLGSTVAFQNSSSGYTEIGSLNVDPIPTINVTNSGNTEKWASNDITPTISPYISLFSFGFESGQPRALIAVNDDQQPAGNAAKVRFFQLLANKSGTNQDLIFSTSSTLGDVSETRFTISNVSYPTSNATFGSIELKEGNYFLTVTDTGDEGNVTKSTGTTSHLFSKGKLYDVILFEDSTDATNGIIKVIER